jgi:hypothetical protein
MKKVNISKLLFETVLPVGTPSFEEIIEYIQSYIPELSISDITANDSYFVSKFSFSLPNMETIDGNLSLRLSIVKDEKDKINQSIGISFQFQNSDNSPQSLYFTLPLPQQLSGNPEIERVAKEIKTKFISGKDVKKAFWRDFFRALFATKQISGFKFNKQTKVATMIRKSDNSTVEIDLKTEEYVVFDSEYGATGSIYTEGNPEYESRRIIEASSDEDEDFFVLR